MFRNSLWCVDKHGGLGQIEEISGDAAVFRYTEAPGELVRVPLEDLKQCQAHELPEGHGMSDVELAALGYTGEE